MLRHRKKVAMPRCEQHQEVEILPVPDEIAACEERLKTGDE
jgi:hypothetical protein